MPDRPEPRAKAALIAAVLVVVFLVVPTIYVLSFGPAAWMAGRGIINGEPGSVAHWFYFPLIWLADNVPWFEHALEEYVKLFVGR